MNTKKKRKTNDFNPASRDATARSAVPGLNLDAFEQLSTRKRDATACEALIKQEVGSVSKGFDPKPALPPHRRPAVTS